MKYFFGLRLLILVVFLGFNFISCQGDDDTSTANTLTLQTIDPPTGSSVTDSTTLTAEIQYSIANYDTTQSYAVFIWFKKTDNSSQFLDVADGVEPITSASGSVTHEYAISDEVNDNEIKKPLEIIYALHSYSPGGVQPGESGFDYDGSYLTQTETVTYTVD